MNVWIYLINIILFTLATSVVGTIFLLWQYSPHTYDYQSKYEQLLGSEQAAVIARAPKGWQKFMTGFYFWWYALWVAIYITITLMIVILAMNFAIIMAIGWF